MPKREVEFTPWGFLAVFCSLDEQGTCEIYHKIPGFHTFPDNNFALACEVHTMFNFNPGPSIWNFRSNSFCLTRAIVLEMRVFGVQCPCWLRPNTCAKRLEDEENIRSRWPNWRLIHREVGSCSQQAFSSVHSLTTCVILLTAHAGTLLFDCVEQLRSVGFLIHCFLMLSS